MKELDFQSFQNYVINHIKGLEKGEAQIFLDHFFYALGFSNGLKDAGANCEFRIKGDQKNSTKFADLVWKPVVLIEMKKRNTDLSLHYQQAFDYWTKLVPNRPQYLILCNFNEFWIYDLNVQVYEPLEKVKIEQLHEKTEVFAFMFPKPRNPIFNYNKEEVTEKAAYFVSFIYRSMVQRIASDIALKYCMQMVLTMFAEDVELLPNHIFTRLIKDLLKEPGEGPDTVAKSYDVISGLFTAMNTQGITSGGMYKDVEYFNGGLFDKIYPIELTKHELTMIDQAASYNWRKINPAIFGSLFEFALDAKERHKLGAHYTHEIDIKKIVVPVIVRPWLEKIEQAENLNDLYLLLDELSNFKVLDPACGSGNFLFVAFKEMKLLEKMILQQIRDKSSKPTDAKILVKFLSNYKYVTTKQFYGMDIKPFAVELAKVTLMIAKELIWLEDKETYDNKDKPLPLDNLDQFIVCTDALIDNKGNEKIWPAVDAIIGNPPYQGKTKMQHEFGVEYINRLRQVYPEVPARADFCVYWFYKAHKCLKNNNYAGLIGTNTIRENNSREGSLDFILNNGGVIIDAISSQKWSGEATVNVSIVNWKKGAFNQIKTLWIETDQQLQSHNLAEINSSLSLHTDVSKALKLNANTTTKVVFQGQTHGHDSFLVSKNKALQWIKKNPEYSDVLKPFLIGSDLISNYQSQPSRFVIDFTNKNLSEASQYKKLFQQIEKEVLPEIKNKADLEKTGKIKLNGREAWLDNWWLLWRKREAMQKAKDQLKRFIACSRITPRPIFEFVSSGINPNDKIMCFMFEDDYSFGIIQSNIHWTWFTAKSTTLGTGFNYNTESIWDTFPWPQNPTDKQIEAVAKVAKELRDTRNTIMQKNKLTLRDLYRLMEKPGKFALKDLHEKLDNAVLEAYGFEHQKDILEQLLNLNIKLSDLENKQLKIQKPGIPDHYMMPPDLISTDCVCFDSKNKL